MPVRAVAAKAISGTGKRAVVNRGIFSQARKESKRFVSEAMRVAATRKGAQNVRDKMALGALADVVGGEKGRVAWISMINWAVEALKSYGIAFGPWNDQTGNLRRSYVTQVTERKGVILGIFANTANYATDVEFKPKKWVVSGAVRAVGPSIRAVVGSRLKFSEMKKATGK